jgi:dephospho-CoA kinase
MIKRILWHFYNGTNILVLDSPLLYETKMDRITSSVIVVWVDEQTQIQRLKKRDNLEEEQALQRISSQMPLDRKKQMATYVIDNSKSIEETQQQVDSILPFIPQSLTIFKISLLRYQLVLVTSLPINYCELHYLKFFPCFVCIK